MCKNRNTSAKEVGTKLLRKIPRIIFNCYRALVVEKNTFQNLFTYNNLRLSYVCLIILPYAV